MNDQTITVIEVFATPHCNRCQGAKILVESVVKELALDEIHWREVNVIEEIDYAVELGVIATPAIAINGKLVFTSLPARRKLISLIHKSIQQTP